MQPFDKAKYQVPTRTLLNDISFITKFCLKINLLFLNMYVHMILNMKDVGLNLFVIWSEVDKGR